MANFKEAHAITQASEGVYSNDPTDRGGETVYGIARKSNPHWDGWELIDQMTTVLEPLNAHQMAEAMNELLSDTDEVLERAEDLYKEKYWDVLKLDDMTSQKIANELFDTAVNQGPGTSAKYLQEALNLLNNDGSAYPDLTIDGGIGKKSLAALERYMSTSNWKSRDYKKVESTMVKVLNGLQFMKYHKIVTKDSEQEKYFFGWVNMRN